MLSDVVRIGNSKGIRIPVQILKECSIKDKIHLEVQDGKIIITPVNNPRENWDAEFKLMHENGDDKLIIDDILDDDMEDWEWQ